MAAIAAAYAISLSYWSIRNQRGFLTFGFDVGIFDQGVWLLSKFDVPFVTVRGLNLFGDHTSFILLLLVPFYWVFETADVLYIAQSLALGSGAVLVFLIAREKLRSEPASAIFALAYLLQPALGWTNLENFHPDSFEVPLVLLCLFLMIKQRWRWFLLSVILLLLVKEDVAVLTVPLGLYVARFHNRRAGLATVVLSVVWFLLAFYVVIPAFNPAGPLYASRLALGGITGTLEALVTRPFDVIRLVVSENKPWFLLQLIAPLAALSLVGWRVGLIAAGTLLVNLLSTFPYQYSIQYHYTTLIVPVLVAAAIFGVAGLRTVRGRTRMSAVVLAAAGTGAFLWGPLPWTRDPGPIGDPSSAFAVDARRAIATIPATASVAVLPSLVPHLSQRQEIFEFPNPWRATNWGDSSADGERLSYAGSVDYLIVPPNLSPQDRSLVQEVTDDFEVELTTDNLVVYRRKT